MQQNIEVSEMTVGDNFSKYNNDKLIALDSMNFFKYGVHYRFNYIVENTENDFNFLDFKIKKIAFNNDNGLIKDIVLFIVTSDIDNFYAKLEDKYGKPGTARISSKFLKKHGYLKPTQVDSSEVDSYYQNVPIPDSSDFKDLNGVSWYDLKTKLQDSIEVNMHVLNFINKSLPFEDSFEVQITFRVMENIE